MKKLFMLAAVAAFSLSSCSDDDKTNTRTVNTAFLVDGVWEEVAPDPNHRTLSFDHAKVTLSREDGISTQSAYTISGNKLIFGTPAEHTVEVIDDLTMKVSNIYIAADTENGTPETVTFKKIQFSIEN